MVLVALAVTVLLHAIGMGLLSVTNTEAAIATNARQSFEALHAAEAAAEAALADVSRAPSWTAVLSGASMSTLLDGTLAPVLASGERLDLAALTAAWQAVSDAAARRGADNPRWRLFLYGPLARLARSPHPSAYVAAWVADDEAETDGDPLADGNGVVTVRAQAFGPGGLQRTVEATVAREAIGMRLLSWREVR
jgi:hypothetical protein